MDFLRRIQRISPWVKEQTMSKARQAKHVEQDNTGKKKRKSQSPRSGYLSSDGIGERVQRCQVEVLLERD